MLEGTLRNQYQRFCVDPFAAKLNSNVKPIHITILAGLLGLLVIPTLLFDLKFLAIILILFSGYCDTLDGTLARMQQSSSEFGTVLDITTDRFVEFCIIFALYLVAPQTRAFATILMLGSILICVTSFLVVGVFAENDGHKSFHYSPGIIERAEAFLFFIAMILLPNYFALIAIVFAILVLVTAIYRLYEFYQAYH